MSDRIEKTIDLSAPMERVWRALTDHTEFGAWFQVDLDGPFELGGVSTGRITHPSCGGAVWRATVTRMDRPHLFAFTWPHAADMFVDGIRDDVESPSQQPVDRQHSGRSGRRVGHTDAAVRRHPAELLVEDDQPEDAELFPTAALMRFGDERGIEEQEAHHHLDRAVTPQCGDDVAAQRLPGIRRFGEALRMTAQPFWLYLALDTVLGRVDALAA